MQPATMPGGTIAGTSMPAGAATSGTMPAAAAAVAAVVGARWAGTAWWCGGGVMKALLPLPTRVRLDWRPPSPPSSSSWVLLASASNREPLEGAGPIAAAAAAGAGARRRRVVRPLPPPMAPLPSSSSSSCSASAFSWALVDGRRCRRLLASGPAAPPEPTVAAAPADACSAVPASCHCCHGCCPYCCGGSAPAAAEGRCGLRLVAPRSGTGVGRPCCSERVDTLPEPSRDGGPPPWLHACPDAAAAAAAPRPRLALPGPPRGSGASALAASCGRAAGQKGGGVSAWHEAEAMRHLGNNG